MKQPLLIIILTVFQFSATVLAAQDLVEASIKPDKIYTIRTESAQTIDFDLYLENKQDETLNLHEIRMVAYDNANNKLLQKQMGYQGLSPSILTIPHKELLKDVPICVFNPFYSFNPNLEIDRLELKLTFATKNRKKEFYKTIEIKPIYAESKTSIYLPVKVKSMIRDGNDFYSHHRRFDFTHPAAVMLGIKQQANRFAYDFCPTNEQGEMYKNKGEQLEDWYGFGAEIYASADGKVVGTFNDAIDPEVGQIAFDYTDAVKNNKIMLGNYAIIDHQNGEFSVFMHMKKDSVKVKAGDTVKRGQVIGQLGNSGDSFLPHLHYQLTDHADAMNSAGIPLYFRKFYRIRGADHVKVDKGHIETGEIIKSQ